MSQIGQAKAEVAEIAAGLKKLGPDRVVALSTHKVKDGAFDGDPRRRAGII